MSELRPRIEHKKSAAVSPSATLKLKENARATALFRGDPSSRPALRAERPNPIGVLVDASVTVKFREGTGVRLEGGGDAFARAFAGDPERARRMARLGLSEATLGRDLAQINTLLSTLRPLQLRVRPTFDPAASMAEPALRDAEKSLGRELADVGLYHALSMPCAAPEDLERVVRALQEHDAVEVAYATPLPYLPQDLAPTTPMFGGQGYLGAAPLGIDALFAHALPGGSGEGVRIVDVEFAWRLDHEDLPPMFLRDIGLNPEVYSAADHGLAVLGVLCAQRNGYGFTGVAPGALVGVCTWLTVSAYAGAVERAAMHLRRGDILVVEVHVPGPTSTVDDVLQNRQTGFVPMEHVPAAYDAIERATARGVVVVSAAGNGSQDLDAPMYEGRYDRARRDSGAIMVGAGTAGGRVPSWFTNYGARVDVHGWGDAVSTLGYGDVTVPGAEQDKRQWYTARFGGTSSATPIVAGAAALIQGLLMRAGREPLGAAEMRRRLRDTGTPQSPDARQIGPLPNLRAALDGLLPPPPTPDVAWSTVPGVILSPPVVAKHPDGALRLFAIGNDGRLLQCAQSAVRGDLGGWSRMSDEGLPASARFVGRPAVARGADGRLELFARADDQHLWHSHQAGPAGPWSRWLDMGGAFTSDPVVGVNDNGRLEVFIRGAQSVLMHNWQMWPDGPWHTFGWQSLGGNLQGAPAVTRSADRRLVVFSRGTGNALQCIAQLTPGGAWDAWKHLGGVLSADPVACIVSTPTGERGVALARGGDGAPTAAWQAAPNAGFVAPEPFGGAHLAPDARAALVRDNDGGVVAVARFDDGSVQMRRQNPRTGALTGWSPLGGAPTAGAQGADPAAAVDVDGTLWVFARGAQGELRVHRAR